MNKTPGTDEEEPGVVSKVPVSQLQMSQSLLVTCPLCGRAEIHRTLFKKHINDECPKA